MLFTPPPLPSRCSLDLRVCLPLLDEGEGEGEGESRVESASSPGVLLLGARVKGVLA